MVNGDMSWTISPDQITVDERIGGGAFGIVYRGTYSGSVVALKQLFADMANAQALNEVSVAWGMLLFICAFAGRDDDPLGLVGCVCACAPAGAATLQLKAEATLLSHLHHPNVLHFYGVCCRGKDVFLVTEFCPASVLNYLMDPQADHSLPMILTLALQTARGMRYLHSKGVIHRDLKPDNLLLTAAGQVRVCDFGLARVQISRSMTVNKVRSQPQATRVPMRASCVVSRLGVSHHRFDRSLVVLLLAWSPQGTPAYMAPYVRCCRCCMCVPPPRRMS